jgi:hypothetical protein
MSRSVLFAMAMAALLTLSMTAHAAPVHKKHHASRHSHRYGFLPGYRAPDPLRRSGQAQRDWDRDDWDRGDWYRGYWYGDDWYWYGRPGWYRGRWNGGSLGPCWTDTPIGLMWTCGR